MIFFEGARITLEAHMVEYPAECHDALRRVLAMGDHWRSDRIIVLTSSTATIEKHIKLRNRPYEVAENMVRRFRLIDAEFRRLAALDPSAVIVDRDGMEFHERSGLDGIVAAAGLPKYPRDPLPGTSLLKLELRGQNSELKAAPSQVLTSTSEF